MQTTYGACLKAAYSACLKAAYASGLQATRRSGVHATYSSGLKDTKSRKDGYGSPHPRMVRAIVHESSRFGERVNK